MGYPDVFRLLIFWYYCVIKYLLFNVNTLNVLRFHVARINRPSFENERFGLVFAKTLLGFYWVRWLLKITSRNSRGPDCSYPLTTVQHVASMATD